MMSSFMCTSSWRTIPFRHDVIGSCQDAVVRLLVVEDDPALGAVVQRGLREDGHSVDLAATIAGATRAITLDSYDLVVLDLGLPDGDGVTFCRELRATDAATRVLMMTARDASPDVVHGLDAGADDYITKPFDYPVLAARVRALLRRPARGGNPILSAGTIALDPASHRVTSDTVVIPLTAREFSLLHFLMSRSGEVVSRSDIIDHVWDAHLDPMSNVVDVHVAQLRRKLASHHGEAPIETIRGVGYRFGAVENKVTS